MRQVASVGNASLGDSRLVDRANDHSPGRSHLEDSAERNSPLVLLLASRKTAHANERPHFTNIEAKHLCRLAHPDGDRPRINARLVAELGQHLRKNLISLAGKSNCQRLASIQCLPTLIDDAAANVADAKLTVLPRAPDRRLPFTAPASSL